MPLQADVKFIQIRVSFLPVSRRNMNPIQIKKIRVPIYPSQFSHDLEEQDSITKFRNFLNM